MIRWLFARNKINEILLFVGGGLRLIEYLYNRSIWRDEAALALNIITKSYTELLQPLDYQQTAPLGFLLLEKVSVQFLGTSEYALRLFPFLASLFSLWLFYKVSQQFLATRVVPIAVALFTLSHPLIYYAAEVKQYSFDVTVALLIYLLVDWLGRENLKLKMIFVAGSAGVLLPWFSYITIFLLGAVVLTYLLTYSTQQRAVLVRYGFMFAIWGAGFLLVYTFSLRQGLTNGYLREFWEEHFMPFPPTSVSDVRWFYASFVDIFRRTGGFAFPKVAGLLYILGSWWIFRRNKKHFFLLMTPLFLTLVASGLQFYPFRGRLLLFLLPSIIITCGLGIEYLLLYVRLPRFLQRKKFAVRYIKFGIVGLLFFHPLLYAVNHLYLPRSAEEIKPALNYIIAHQQADDKFFIYSNAALQFSYYAPKYRFAEGRYFISNWNHDNYREVLEQLSGNPRVWIVYSQIYEESSTEIESFVEYLNSVGLQRDFYQAKRIWVHLYDLSIHE